MIDFDQYWQEVRDEHRRGLDEGLVEWEVIPRGVVVEARGRRWRIDWIRFSSATDMVINGWVARPEDHAADKTGFLWLPGYSYGTPPPDATNLVRGAVTLCINVHGNAPDAPYVNPAGKNDYIAEGVENPSSYIYRAIVLHCLNAMSVLGELDGVDDSKTVVAGMSQGGALALLTAANHRGPRVCFADMPFFCSVKQALTISHSPAYKEIASVMSERSRIAEQILDTICLFDPLFHAPKITVPTSLLSGGKDPASRAATIEPVYAALGSTVKQYRHFPDAGHVFLPEMPQTYIDWIDRLVLQNDGFRDA